MRRPTGRPSVGAAYLFMRTGDRVQGRSSSHTSRRRHPLHSPWGSSARCRRTAAAPSLAATSGRSSTSSGRSSSSPWSSSLRSSSHRAAWTPSPGASSVRAGSAVPPCAASEVDLLPCEDPRRSSRLSREMNYYRERHCPARGEAPACLVPPPQGYRVPVPWPESLHKD
ncbi:hypothetical protein PR202_gb14647 [Eleusine coracana subsp. coracana]|uniref:Methyltransferase n=1 Tax=Eleusine coracana subsp. coracana TaxID=191504 RepID=A0AAV5EWT1_ELECO|nr:hypothetical protein PR202_gb14647 [Eleusine coracana subsp. coracana]